MPLLLDAYNILHVVGVLPPDLAGIDLEELADLVAGSRFRGEETILVCDGTPRRHAVGHSTVHVRFAGPGVTADEAIMRLVRRSNAPRRVTVVTSDREIAQAVRRRRATVIGSDRFLAMLAEDHALPAARPRTPGGGHHPADRRQVEAWLRLFDLDPELEALPSTSPPSRDDDRRPATSTHPEPTPSEVPATPRRPTSPRRPGRSVLEASSLADIDPASLDELDTGRLLDASGDPPPSPEPGDNAASDSDSI